MTRYVALFRGINVGKAKRIAMGELRALLEELGYADVSTLLNSGNAVFTGRAAPPPRHAGRIRAAVADRLGVDAHVIVKSARDIGAIISGNALRKVATDPSRLLVLLRGDGRGFEVLRKLAADDWGDERIHAGRHAAYVWCAGGILESRLLQATVRQLGDVVTSRNWATLNKILALMGPDER